MNKYNIEQMIKEGKGSIVDVRTPAEFMGGHVIGSVNIPLNEIPEQLENLKMLESPLILCCASGMRSSQAERYLSQMGIESVNGGSWQDVNFFKNITV